MKLLDKIKNVFFEEEEIEVEEKPKKIKKEKPLVKKIETPKPETREARTEQREEEEILDEDILEDDKEVLEEHDLLRRNSDEAFKFPVILDDEEQLVEEEKEYKEEKRENNIYGVSDSNRVEVSYESDYHPEPYSNSYTRDFNSASYSLTDRKEVKAFKPSPVISPVYGILDKNYKSDDIKEKNKPDKKENPIFSFSSTKLDLDEVRAKAYGLEEEINTEENDIEEENDNYDETIDMTDTEMKPVVDSVTVGDAEEYFEDLGLEYNVDYKDSKKKKRSRKKTDKEKEEIEMENEDNLEDEDVVIDKPKKKRSKDSEEENDIDVEIEDNLFDLIDSMYDEGE